MANSVLRHQVLFGASQALAAAEWLLGQPTPAAGQPPGFLDDREDVRDQIQSLAVESDELLR